MSDETSPGRSPNASTPIRSPASVLLTRAGYALEPNSQLAVELALQRVGLAAGVLDVATRGDSRRLSSVPERTSSPSPAPITMPTASARNTAASEAAW